MLFIDNNIQAVLKKLKQFSPKTYEHSINVSIICELFGEYLGLSKNELTKLKVAGLLHDIGKLEIPDEILHKPAKLTNQEYNIVKNHAINGVNILTKNGFNNQEILNLILCHHERPDGLGYPKGLNNSSIPYLARILTICDCYEAMASKRSYKEANDLDYIKNEFIKNAGTQFDKELSNLFLEFLNNQILKSKNYK